MLFSVIIPTYKRNDLLAQCLQRLQPGVQMLDSHSYEVIVSDDSPEGEAAALLQNSFDWVQYSRGPQKGPAANRNAGARTANGKWLVFTDDDCIPDAQWLMGFYRAISENEQVMTFEGKVIPDRPQRNFIEECPINTNGGNLWSCNMAIHREFFLNELKGFDESFPFAASEDVDLRIRISKRNVSSILFVPSAVVVHPWHMKNAPLNLQLKRYQSTRLLLAKHPELRSFNNSKYYFQAFLNGFFSGTLSKAWRFRGRGIITKIQIDFMQLLFAFHILLKGHKKQFPQ